MFYERLRQLRKERGCTLDELAEQYNEAFDAGLNKGTLSKYENGRQEPMVSVVRNFAQLFDVTVDYLLDDDDTAPAGFVLIPILGDVRAGLPHYVTQDIQGYEEISAHTASQGEHFALRINGNSMAERMCDGDIVIVRKQNDAESGDIVVALIENETTTVKKLRKTDNGIILMPFNHSYDPLYYSQEQIQQLPVQIIGKVIELRARY